MGKLTALKVKALTEPGSYRDGDGLMLVVGSNGAASWKLRATIAGKRRDVGVGSLKVLSLADARAKAAELRRQIALGLDPIAERKKVVDPIPTFKEAAGRVHEEQKASWKNGKHQDQ